MALTLSQKVDRVMKLLIGLRNQRIAAALVGHGFGNEDLQEGWSLLQHVTRTQLDAPPETAPEDPVAIDDLDRWENKWFPIASRTLARHAPAAHAWVFRNLSQTEGPAVVVSVGTFVERWDKLDKPVQKGGLGTAGKAAKKILAKRGLTDKVIDTAKALLKKLGTIAGPLPDLTELENEALAYKKAEDELWAWYLEWSGIARVAITQRRLLKQLGFLQDSKATGAADTAETDGGEPADEPGEEPADEADEEPPER